MSNSVGKAREHEKYEKWRKEGRHESKLKRKSLTDEQIRQRVLVAIKPGRMSLRSLQYALQLSVGNWSRLYEIVSELEHEGRLRILSLPEGKIIEPTE